MTRRMLQSAKADIAFSLARTSVRFRRKSPPNYRKGEAPGPGEREERRHRTLVAVAEPLAESLAHHQRGEVRVRHRDRRRERHVADVEPFDAVHTAGS